MISGESESDHYRCPLCSLLQEEVENAPSGDFRFLEFSMLIGE